MMFGRPLANVTSAPLLAQMATDSRKGFGESSSERQTTNTSELRINIAGTSIENYQMVVPTTWNLGPRCADNIPGPLEQALVGLPVADPANPLEVLRVVHAFDPCVACGVHVIDKENDRTHSIKVV